MSISEKQDEKVRGKQRIMGEAETEEHLLAYAEKD
jgi:20S proteasome subunit alpha 1